MTLVSKVMSDYPYEKDNDPAVESGDEETDLRYFKLPYIGQYSTLVKQKLKNLVIQNCEKIDSPDRCYNINNFCINIRFCIIPADHDDTD